MKFFNSIFRRSILGVAVLLVTVFGFYACDSIVGTNSVESGKAKLNVFLTDAPASYDAVYVDIQKVRVRYDSTGTDTAEADSAEREDEAKWITVSESPMRLDLLKLQNGADTLLAAAQLDPGQYSGLRLVLGTDNEVVVHGNSERLKVPSGQQSGYKLKIDADIEADKEYKLLIDFDANRSVHKAGKSGKYILRPVLRTVSIRESDSEPVTGSISGVVQPAEAEPRVFTVFDSDTISTMADTASGAFNLTGLQEGTYDVNINPTNESYSDTTVTGVDVQAGEETSIDTVQVQSN